MIPRVVEVKPLPNFCLWVRFLDGTSGTVDLAHELWGPMFEPLANPDLFSDVHAANACSSATAAKRRSWVHSRQWLNRAAANR
jgi:hypothetical protein